MAGVAVAVSLFWGLLQAWMEAQDPPVRPAHLAARMDVRPGTVAVWAKGPLRRLPTPELFARLVDVTHLPPELLLRALLEDAGYIGHDGLTS